MLLAGRDALTELLVLTISAFHTTTATNLAEPDIEVKFMVVQVGLSGVR